MTNSDEILYEYAPGLVCRLRSKALLMGSRSRRITFATAQVPDGQWIVLELTPHNVQITRGQFPTEELAEAHVEHLYREHRKLFPNPLPIERVGDPPGAKAPWYEDPPAPRRSPWKWQCSTCGANFRTQPELHGHKCRGAAPKESTK